MTTVTESHAAVKPKFRRLKPAHRLFVNGIVAGEGASDIVRRLRPHLKRPDVLASKWRAREDVKAAIAECLEISIELPQQIASIEQRLSVIERLLRTAFCQQVEAS